MSIRSVTSFSFFLNSKSFEHNVSGYDTSITEIPGTYVSQKHDNRGQVLTRISQNPDDV